MDDVKESIGDHVLYDHNFKLLRRHFITAKHGRVLTLIQLFERV